MNVFLLLSGLIALSIGAPMENVLIENPNLFGGDIVFPEGVPKNANILTKKWPNGIIPYKFDSASGYTTAEKSTITSSMRIIESQTGNCLKFIPRTNEAAYVVFNNTNTGCNANAGQMPSKFQPQQVSLQRPGCVTERLVIHELLHVSGFEHEHQRPDRDSYITINFGNAKQEYWSAFQKHTDTQVSTQGFGYDYYSIMHYGRKAFSNNNLDTIVSVWGSGVDFNQVGVATRMSPTDIKKLKKFYGCP